jgi:hypothetical protein
MAEGLIMNNDKTGGAAFPLESDYGSQKGMTLRDYFAGQALVAFLGHDPNWNAEMAYRAADAMIAEREKGGE